MTDTVEDRTDVQLHRGLRLAALVVAVVIVCGLGLSNLLRHWEKYATPGAQVTALALLMAVLAGEAALLTRGRSWGRLCAPAVAVVLAASALSYATLPQGQTSTTTDWIFGAANWAGLVVLFGRPLRDTGMFLAGHELLALLNVFLLHDPTIQALARFATGSVSAVGFPLCVAVGAAVLRDIGARAAAARRELEQVRIAAAVAAEPHRRARPGCTAPLLEGFAPVTLCPQDPEAQRRSASEAARMQRLFAEIDTVANPLLHELRHCADVADRKGVEVELDARGRWPTPPVAVR